MGYGYWVGAKEYIDGRGRPITTAAVQQQQQQNVKEEKSDETLFSLRRINIFFSFPLRLKDTHTDRQKAINLSIHHDIFTFKYQPTDPWAVETWLCVACLQHGKCPASPHTGPSIAFLLHSKWNGTGSSRGRAISSLIKTRQSYSPSLRCFALASSTWRAYNKQ